MAQQIPDVRVRLSAEGVDEVVRAFQQVAAAGKKAGQDAHSGFSLLGGSLSKLSAILPALGFAGTVAGLGAMVKASLDAATAIGKLHEKTGISVETLSVIRVAAKQTGFEMEDLSKALGKFSKTMGALDQGSSEAASAVRRLFGSSQALNGLNSEERFIKVTQAISQMTAGYNKASITQALFGRGGAEIIPVLNKLGTNFDEIKEKALRMGLILDGDTVTGAKKTKRALSELKEIGEGLALQFTAGLAPGLGNAVQQFAKDITGSGVNGLKEVGVWVGVFVKSLVLVFETLGKGIGTSLAIAETLFEDFKDRLGTGFDQIGSVAAAVFEALRLALKGDFAGAGAAIKDVANQTDRADEDLQRRSQERGQRIKVMAKDLASTVKADYANLFGAKAAGAEAKFGADDVGGKAPMIETAKARLELLKARIQNELAVTKKGNELALADEQRLYDQGLGSLREHYDKRAALINDGVDKEVRALQRERQLIQNSPLDLKPDASDDQRQAAETKRKQELEALDNKIALAQLDREGKLSANREERRKAEESLAQKRLDIERQIQDAQGDTFGAALLGIQRQAVELAKLHLPPELIAELTRVQLAQARLKQIEREGTLALGQIGNVQAGLQNQVAAGAIFPFEAVERYDAAVQAAIPSLRALAQARIAAAITPEDAQAAAAFALQIDALAISTDNSARQMASFKQSVQESLTSDLTNFFTRGIEQANSFSDAMRGLALSVVDSLRQVAAQMLANIIIMQLLKAVSGFSGGGPVGSPVSGGSVVNAADGGLISGPGTATSDSIPARLSAGEFVVRASSVAQPGVLPLLAAINRGMGAPGLAGRGVPRFASGGMVSAADAIQGGGGGGGGEIYLGIEEGIIVKHMQGFLQSKTGQQIQVENLGKTQKQSSRALGR